MRRRRVHYLRQKDRGVIKVDFLKKKVIPIECLPINIFSKTNIYDRQLVFVILMFKRLV